MSRRLEHPAVAFDAADVLRGRLDDTTVRQAANVSAKRTYDGRVWGEV